MVLLLNTCSVHVEYQHPCCSHILIDRGHESDRSIFFLSFLFTERRDMISEVSSMKVASPLISRRLLGGGKCEVALIRWLIKGDRTLNV